MLLNKYDKLAIRRYESALSKAQSSIDLPVKNFFQWLAKDMGDPKGNLKRGGVFALLDGSNSLARDAHSVAQIGLRHFVCQKS